MSAGGLAKSRLGRLHDVMAGYVERGEIPGLVTLISRRGAVHVDVIGTLQALGAGGPMQRDTLFRIASLTKPVVAAAAMILVEECRLRLDDPVDPLLPELAGRRVLTRLDGSLDDTEPAQRPITLRDLLTCRLGFGIVMEPPDSTAIQRAMSGLFLGQGPPHPATPPAPDEWLRRFATLPLLHQPGERWMYNTASDVLGVLIARAAGQPLETFLRQRLFEPLGMKDTAFSVPAADIDRLATAYEPHPETGALVLYDPAAGGQWSRPPAFPSGGGGLVGTIDDYQAFSQMMLDQGLHDGDRLLSRAAIQLMTTDHLTPHQKSLSGLYPGQFDNEGWGFGLAVLTRRDDLARNIGTYGWDGGLGTSWYADPRESLAAILMTQRAWTSPIPPAYCRDFWTSVYQAIDD